MSSQIPRIESVAGPDGVHLRRLESGLVEETPLQKDRAPFFPEFEYHLPGTFISELFGKLLVVPPPECPGLLIAQEQQIYQGKYLLRKLFRFPRRP